MEFNLYQFSETAIYQQWTRFPAVVLGLADNGPFVDLWKQVRRTYKDDEQTTTNTDATKMTTSLADIGDPTAVSFSLINPITGETIGAMSVAEFIAAAYSLSIWLDQRVVDPVEPVAPVEPVVETPNVDPVV